MQNLFVNTLRLTETFVSPQVIYQLKTFGIPSDLPITNAGKLKNKNHLKWIRMRKAIDAVRNRDPSGVSIGTPLPANADVLFESGGHKSRHYGNLEFLDIMEQQIEERGLNGKYDDDYYEEAIAAVKAKGGRFLERDPEGHGWWVEITDQWNLHTKLYSALYEQKKRMKVRQQTQQVESSESHGMSAVYPDNKRQKFCQGC